MDKRNVYREDSPNWRGGRFISHAGYVMVYEPNHPMSSRQGYIQEHRLVMEKKLGRFLKKFPFEIVHHIDGNKQNNASINLELKNNSDHSRLTHKKYDDGYKICIHCGKQYGKHKRFSMKQWGQSKYCSLICSARGNKSEQYPLRSRGITVKEVLE